MDLGNPQDWAQGAGAFKAVVEAFANVYKLIKDARSAGNKPSPAEDAAIDRALGEAEKASKVAEAQIAKALGYQLCHCTFPPTAMLTVGRALVWPGPAGPVYECPKCGYNDHDGTAYHRIALPRPVEIA